MQITISIQVIDAPQVTVTQDILNEDVGPHMTLADLKGLIESDSSVPTRLQRIYNNGQELFDDSKTLEQCGIVEGAFLGLVVRDPGNPRAGSGRPMQTRGATHPSPGRQGTRRGPDPEMTRLRAVGDPNYLARLRTQNPTLADAKDDPVRFRQIIEEMERQQEHMEAERQRRQDLLAADPFNVDAQREIEEMIREEQVIENMQNAMEYNPEAFARVQMLYIPVEVNGHKVKAFVDSGAQTTIMSPSCAEKCEILRLLDKRYSGIARGVGTARILGRVHSAQIKIGTSFLPCTFTVMEGKDVDLLLGLDMLKKHQACIDLRQGKLLIQGDQVDFLGDADIPKPEEIYQEEPTVEGPSGQRTGAITGTVKGPGTGSSSATSGQQSGSASTASASASAQQPQSTTGPASFPSRDIEQLMQLGCTREVAIHALEMAGGNVEMAAGLLL